MVGNRNNIKAEEEKTSPSTEEQRRMNQEGQKTSLNKHRNNLPITADFLYHSSEIEGG
jgi:hypothetical protein